MHYTLNHSDILHFTLWDNKKKRRSLYALFFCVSCFVSKMVCGQKNIDLCIAKACRNVYINIV